MHRAVYNIFYPMGQMTLKHVFKGIFANKDIL